jgi:hypothetical protein
MEHRTVVILVVLWFFIVISNSLFYFLNNDARLKRKVHPWLIISDGIVFMAFIFWLERRRMTWGYAVNVLITTAVITFYNIKAAVFCDNCGRTLFQVWPLQRFRFCPQCGAPSPH